MSTSGYMAARPAAAVGPAAISSDMSSVGGAGRPGPGGLSGNSYRVNATKRRDTADEVAGTLAVDCGPGFDATSVCNCVAHKRRPAPCNTTATPQRAPKPALG